LTYRLKLNTVILPVQHKGWQAIDAQKVAALRVASRAQVDGRPGLPWLLHFVDGQDAREQLNFMIEVAEDNCYEDDLPKNSR